MNGPRSQTFSEPSSRQFEFNLIYQKRILGTIRNYAMDMFPRMKRTENLNIFKLSAGNVILMPCQPSLPKGTEVYPKFDFIAVSNASRLSDEFDPLPRRRESEKRSGLLVPTEGKLRGGGNRRAFGEALRCQIVLSPGN